MELLCTVLLYVITALGKCSYQDDVSALRFDKKEPIVQLMRSMAPLLEGLYGVE